jgi:glutaredoxin 1
MKAIVYGTSKCSWCDKVANMLGDNEIEVEKIDVSESKEHFQSMKKAAGKSVTTVPQVIIDGKFVGGYTEVERFINRL